MTSTVLENQVSINDSKSIIREILPYQVLHLASKFASKDDNRHILQYINCYKIADSLVIESTNGHYLFRWVGKINDYYEFPYDNSILIHKDHFNKSDIKATNVDFYSDNTYQVWHATNKSLHTFKNGKDYGTYPNLEQLIPDKLDCLPGTGISFNSQYLGLYFNAIQKYQSSNKVSTLFSNKPTTPVIIKSELDFNRLEDTDVTFLIMPVIKRK